MLRKLVMIGIVILAGASSMQGQSRSLYDRIGGEPAIRRVVDEFVARAAANPRVNFTRGGRFTMSESAVKTLKAHLVDFPGSAFGGPQKYTGRSMKAADQGMQITGVEFQALAEDLQAVLEANKVPRAEMVEIMKIAASTAGDIVEKK